MSSLMTKIAIDVNRAVNLVNTIQMLGFFKDIFEVDRADPDSSNISVINNNTFFLYKLFYFFL